MDKQRSLRTMLLRIAILPTVALLLILSGIVLLSANLVRQEVDERQQLAIDTLVHQTQHFLDDTEQLISLLAETISARTDSEQTQILAQARDNYPRFSTLYLLDGTGRVLAEDSDVETVLGLDMSGAAFYRHVRDRKQAHFSDPFLSISTKEIAITVAIPVFREGRLWRVLVGELNLQRLKNVIVQTSMGQQDSSFIVDEHGTLIAHSNPSWVQERRNLGNHPLVAAQLAQTQAPSVFYDTDQDRWLVGRATTMETGWIAVTTQPLTAAARPMFVFTGISMAAFVLSLFLFLWMQGYNLLKITRPISQLVQQANMLAQDPSQPLPSEPIGEYAEIASLSASFVHMAEAIAQRTTELSQELEQRKRAQEALSESEERYRGLFDGVPIGLYRTTPEGQVLDVNSALIEMLGYPDRASLLEANAFTRYVEPEERSRWQSLVERDGMVRGFQTGIYRYDGTAIWVRETAHAVRDQNDRVLYYEGSLEDITEHRRAEEALRRSNEFLQSILDNSPSSVFVRDLEGRYLLVNHAYQNVIGHSSEEAIGRHPDELDGSQIAALISRGDSTVLENGMPYQLEVDVLVDDEPHTFIGTKVPLRDASGQIFAICAVATDITDRKRAEVERERLQERLIQSQKMEAIGRLASSIAHDFNNVLTAIKGYAHLLRDDLASDDPRDWPPATSFRSDLGEILTSANRATSLTQQLLAFSRKQVLQPRAVKLDELLRNMESMLKRLIGEDIDLAIVPAEGLDYVHADPGQIEQVVMNLAVNARDAMPNGGKLTFHSANVEIDDAYTSGHPDFDPGRYVLLSVSDSGLGMNDKVKAHLFEPFFTTKEQGRGTGLGLATVYGIVQQSGGHIEVDSQVGVGTTFKVYLPVAEETLGLDEPTEAGETMPSGSETVLLAEDEQPVRDLVNRVLGRCGYVVLTAGHPQDAVELSKELDGDIHLLITDIVMPDMNGEELAGLLTLSRPEMKVLYISGYTDKTIAHQGELDPDTALLRKPFTPSALAQKVREVLDEPSRRE